MQAINELEIISSIALDTVCGGAATQVRTQVRAPLSGSVHQSNFGNVNITAPKATTMTWGANTLWGNFSFSMSTK